MRSWNIETDQLIQEFRFVLLKCFKVKNQYLVGVENDEIKVLDLQSNKLIKIFLNEGKGFENLASLFIAEDKIIYVNNDCTIRILNLNDLKSLKEIKGSKNRKLNDVPTCSIGANSNSKIIYVDDDCPNMNLNELKSLNEIKDSENRKLNGVPTCSIGADSKRLAVVYLDGDVVIHDFTENLRKKYLKHL